VCVIVSQGTHATGVWVTHVTGTLWVTHVTVFQSQGTHVNCVTGNTCHRGVSHTCHRDTVSHTCHSVSVTGNTCHRGVSHICYRGVSHTCHRDTVSHTCHSVSDTGVWVTHVTGVWVTHVTGVWVTHVTGVWVTHVTGTLWVTHVTVCESPMLQGIERVDCCVIERVDCFCVIERSWVIKSVDWIESRLRELMQERVDWERRCSCVVER